jgi:hypothetical protein
MFFSGHTWASMGGSVNETIGDGYAIQPLLAAGDPAAHGEAVKAGRV